MAGAADSGGSGGGASSPSASAASHIPPATPDAANADDEIASAESLVLAQLPGETPILWPGICYDPMIPGAPADLIKQHAGVLKGRVLYVSVPESMRPNGNCSFFNVHFDSIEFHHTQ